MNTFAKLFSKQGQCFLTGKMFKVCPFGCMEWKSLNNKGNHQTMMFGEIPEWSRRCRLKQIND